MIWNNKQGAKTSITRLETKHHSYVRAAAGVDEGEDAPPEELQTLK